MITALWLLLEFAASVLVSYVVFSEIEYRRWRFAVELFTAAPMSVTPPTMTELHAGALGYDLALIPREDDGV